MCIVTLLNSAGSNDLDRVCYFVDAASNHQVLKVALYQRASVNGADVCVTRVVFKQ
eukprot:m.899055 g.899055  ORF g.899055 m.899055 type:complete len:56 (-) comp23677_c0_seq5:742-909(-)